VVGLTTSLRRLILAVVATATIVAVVVASQASFENGIAPPGGTPAAGIAFWTFVTLLASAFPVRMPRGTVVSPSIAPVVVASAIGGPLAALVVGGLGTTELRELRLRIPWYGVAYNHAVIILAAIWSSITYGVLVGFGTSPLTPAGLLALTLAGLAYLAVNLSLTAAAIAVREGRSFTTLLSADVGAHGASLFGLVPVAWLMAAAYAQIGMLSVVTFAVPLYTTRAAYKSVIEIRNMFTQTVQALASAIDARDPNTKLHSKSVAEISVEIGEEMGLREADIETLEWAGLLHDIGKIGVPDAILRKPGRLDKQERMTMNLHPSTGWQILLGVEKLRPELPVILHHHQWWNGSGYPKVRSDGGPVQLSETGEPVEHGRPLIGEEIPLLARILHVADAFDAMTASRPYRPNPMSPAQALEELRKYAGIQFDPRVVESFARTKTAREPRRKQGSVPDPTTGSAIPTLGQVAALRSSSPVSMAVDTR
jgi:putative nucleotidyltransferase with HDIG domain